MNIAKLELKDGRILYVNVAHVEALMAYDEDHPELTRLFTMRTGGLAYVVNGTPEEVIQKLRLAEFPVTVTSSAWTGDEKFWKPINRDGEK